MNNGRILMVAGGTGGHIMPAISFGYWAAEHRCAEIAYVCGARPLEYEIYSSAGISPRIIKLEGSPLSGGVSAKVRAGRMLDMIGSLGEARKILMEFRPEHCVLFGGYISLPFLLLCKMMNIPVTVHEQNACAGLITKLAERVGVPVLTGWETCFPLERKQFKRVGVPVRKFSKPERAEAMRRLNVPDEYAGLFTVVVFSGSLGSVSIKEKILEISSDEKFRDFLFLIPLDSANIEKAADRVLVLPKMWDPSPLFASADCVVTRAGGSILTELAVLGIPALVIPWRGAAGDHQYYNASAFISENIGIILDLENDSVSFAAHIFELRDIVNGCKQRKASQLYGKADKICERFWGAIIS